MIPNEWYAVLPSKAVKKNSIVGILAAAVTLLIVID